MKAIESIKAQVESLIVFKGTTVREVDEEWDTIGKRIDEGIQKMKDYKHFTENEIDDVHKHAIIVRKQRWESARSDVKTKERLEFVF